MWFRRDFFPRSKPRAAKGGIKAQTKRGAFGTSWWAKRWIAVLESFNLGARLQRGRSYARNGQVLSIDVAPGKVTAKVQGSRPKPYDVAINIAELSHKDWDKVLRILSSQALFVAKLLGGEMPQDIEDIFKEVGLSLFPEKQKDLQTECSCPDYSNPCKHIAAVYYLLGEEFDRDPFLLFRLRGLSREELSKKLTAAGAKSAPAAVSAPEPVATPEALPLDAAHFWGTGSVPADVFGEVKAPSTAAALPKRLGGFPFWRGQEHFLEALEPTYRAAAEYGLRTFMGEANTQVVKRRA
jgi:uncharacterized Zn finger protein